VSDNVAKRIFYNLTLSILNLKRSTPPSPIASSSSPIQRSRRRASGLPRFSPLAPVGWRSPATLRGPRLSPPSSHKLVFRRQPPPSSPPAPMGPPQGGRRRWASISSLLDGPACSLLPQATPPSSPLAGGRCSPPASMGVVFFGLSQR
jgi:hypothetical protein